MQTLEQLRDLLDYNAWANRRAIAALKALADPPARALRALTHLLVAERTWLRRFQAEPDSTGFNFWPDQSLAECEALADEMAGAYQAFVGGLDEAGLAAAATYKNSKGVEYSTPYREMLMHVVMHSGYHRGQVAMAIRAAGGEPANTDYITFARERRPSS
jgi:uncharacterized damage-inducible protein DinB